MNGFVWSEFWVLFALSLIGAVGILPYAMKLVPEGALERSKLPLPVMMALGTLQTAVLMMIAIGLGMLAAREVGLHAPVIEALVSGSDALEILGSFLLLSVLWGLVASALLLGLERLVFVPRVPRELAGKDQEIEPWKGFLASFYGGINEELLLRWFMVSILAWLIGLVWNSPAVMGIAILLAALLFGLGHLPATRNITPLTPWVVARGIVLNGVGGLIFGYLFWRYGLEAAIIAHFTADLVIHIGYPSWMKASRKQELKTV